MLSVILPLVFTMLFIGFIPNFGISVASFVIAGQSTNVTCDGTMMPLTTWLYVNAAVTMTFATVVIIIMMLLIIFLFKLDGDALIETVASITLFFFFGTLCFTLFLLAWNIVGAVALFRDSSACLNANKPLWAMTLAALIFQWISMVTNWCSGKKTKNDE
jgi:hypothetical protein